MILLGRFDVKQYRHPSSQLWVTGAQVFISVNSDPSHKPLIMVILSFTRPTVNPCNETAACSCIYNPELQILEPDPGPTGGSLIINRLLLKNIRDRQSSDAKANWDEMLVKIDRILEQKLGNL